MTKATNNQAKHMRQTNNGAARKGRGRMVAIALAGVLALGGAGAVCVAGLGKSPGQAPAATQQQATKAATTKTATKPETRQATTKTAAKPAVKQATQQATQQGSKPAVKQATQQARPAQQQQQQTSRPQPQPAKPAQQQQQARPAPQPQPAPQQQQAQPQAEQGSGMEVKVSREGAIAIARDYTGAGGQAKGEAYNVTCRGPITGGGTVYYVVELDLGEVHYSVTVDAVEGNVIGADQVHAGTRTLLDSKTGEPQEGTEQPVDA